MHGRRKGGETAHNNASLKGRKLNKGRARADRDGQINRRQMADFIWAVSIVRNDDGHRSIG